MVYCIVVPMYMLCYLYERSDMRLLFKMCITAIYVLSNFIIKKYVKMMLMTERDVNPFPTNVSL